MLFHARERSYENRTVAGRGKLRVGLLVLVILLFISLVAMAETSLTVELKGVSSDGIGVWRSVPLSARFEVFTGVDDQATSLGVIMANPSGELSDTLIISDEQAQSAYLVPVEEDFSGPYLCAGAIPLALTAGTSNPVAVVAYAQEGYFKLEGKLDNEGEALPAGSAEYVVLDQNDAPVVSFASDEQGGYTLTSPLPVGVYSLVQVSAPKDALPTDDATTIQIEPYYGNGSDITLVEIENKQAPIENRTLSHLSVAGDTSIGAFSTQARMAKLTVSGILDGANTVELGDMSLKLGAAQMVLADGASRPADQSVTLRSLTVSLIDQDLSAKVQLTDVSGAPLGESMPLSPDTPLDVGAYNASAAIIRYTDENGLTVIPDGAHAGTVTAEYAFLPYAPLADEASLQSVIIPLSVDYTFTYPSSDGMSVITDKADAAVTEYPIAIDDGKIQLATILEAVNDQYLLHLDTAASRNLPVDMSLLLSLPAGARVNENMLSESLRLVRMADRDMLVFHLSDLQASALAMPLKACDSDGEATLWALDPKTLPPTTDNPQGLSIASDNLQSDALLRLLIGAAPSDMFASIPCQRQGAFAQGQALVASKSLLSGMIYEDSNMDGTPSSGETVAVQEGVLVDANDGITYAAYTDQSGSFTLLALDDSAAQSGTLRASLPSNTASAEGLNSAYAQSDVALTAQNNIMIGYTKLCQLTGSITLSNGEGVGQVNLTLMKDGQEIATTATDPSGHYSFDNLSMGSGYALALFIDKARNIALTVPQGALSDDGSVTAPAFSLGYGESLVADYQATKLCTLTLYMTNQEQPLAGVSIALSNSAGKLDGQSGEDGLWRVNGLYDGTYTVSITVPQAMAIVSVDGETVKTSSEYTRELTLSGGEALSLPVAFEPTASIQGCVPALGQGQYITAASLYDQFSVTTDENGNYQFDGIPGGDYTIYAPLPEGKTLVSGSLWHVTQQGDMIWMTITVQAGHLYQMPNGEFGMMTAIKGSAFLDLDGTGAYSAGDSMLSGVPIGLQMQSGESWQEVATATTDDYGAFAFMSLDEGVYRLSCSMSGKLFVSTVGGGSEFIDDTTAVSGAISIKSGDILTSGCDVALSSAATLNVAAFVDSNNNAKRADKEAGVEGVLIEVLSGDQETVLASGTTGADGLASLSGFKSGSYNIRFTLPRGYLFGEKGNVINIDISATDRSGDPSQIIGPMTFSSTEALSMGVGLIKAASFSGKVWSDDNSDGIMGEDEEGVAGVQITMTGKKTGYVYTLTTDDTGLYTFGHLAADKYVLTATLPDGMLFARYSKTGGDLRSIITTANVSTGSRDFTVEAGRTIVNKNIGAISEGGITGTAFYDLNYNGEFDPDEPGYAGVTVEIIKNSNSKSQGKTVTDENGQFSVPGLRGGDYRVRAVLPDDGCFFTRVPDTIDEKSNQFVHRDGRRENSLNSLTIGNGGSGSVVIGVARGAKLSGSVFSDANYDGNFSNDERKFGSLNVLLRNEENILVSQTTTGLRGSFAFDNVMPGVYTLLIERKAGYAFTRYNGGGSEQESKTQYMQDGYGVIPDVTVEMGTDIVGLNAGILQSSTLSGIVYSDENDSGAADADEPGLMGVSVRLRSTDMERNPVDLTVETTESGAFLLDGVMPGDYDLIYTLPEHVQYAGTHDEQREMILSIKGMIAGENREVAPVTAVVLGSFIGTAFDDHNANGVQDEGEGALSGATITLTPAKSGLEATSVQTGADGIFSLTQLRPSEYTLSIELPQGLIFSCDLTSDALDVGTEQTTSLACPWTALISRAPIALGAVQPAQISGYIGLDENLNSQQDNGEAMMSGITFELYDEGKQKVVKSMTSGADGQVLFENVRPATYTVRYPLPEQSEMVQSDRSGFVLNGSTVEQTGIVIAEGQTKDDLYGVLCVRTSIGGLVRLDEGGTLSPVADVTVTLYKQSGEMIGSSLTTETGEYRFDGLWPDDYYLTVKRPDGVLFVSTEDERFANGLSIVTTQEGDIGRSDPFHLAMSIDELNKHVTFVIPGMVGDYAWFDENGNGLNDMTELPIAGATVELLKDGQTAYATTTDAEGYYLFSDVYPGTYTLQARTYSELTITKRVENFPILTSCLTSGDGDGAQSEPFTVLSGKKDFNFDLGFMLKSGQTKPSGIAPAPGQDWSISNTND